jgi:hypothetical protein
MSDRWAASLPRLRSGEAVRLWTVPDIEVCLIGDLLWLRGPAWEETLDQALRAMLGCERYAVDDAGLIAPRGDALPVAELPAGPWTLLREYFRLQLPPRKFAAPLPAPAPLTLAPCHAPQPANLLLASLATWQLYVESAPAVRLKLWSFAVREGRRVAVRGVPLPPLPGVACIEVEGVAVPAGWTWSPPLEAAVVRTLLGLAAGDVALLQPDGSYEVIAGEDFVAATRSAVRLSAKEGT